MTQHPTDLHKSVEAAKLLRSEIAKLVVIDKVEAGELSAEDAQAIQDTFDGETTLEAELKAAIEAEDDDQILIDGIKARQETLRARKARLEKRIESRRGLIQQAMTIAGWAKQDVGIATISLGKATPSVEIDVESEIPTQFFKRPDPVLDKSGLGKMLKERHAAITAAMNIADEAERAAKLKQIDEVMPVIPGCHLETAGTKLSVRRK